MPKAIRGRGLIEDEKDITPNLSFDANDASTGEAILGGTFANALYIGAAGNVNIVKSNGVLSLYTALAVGIWHSMPPFRHVSSASTTATTIKAGITFAEPR